MGKLTATNIFGMGIAAIGGVAEYKVASAQYKVDEANRHLNNQRALDALTTSYRALEAETDQVRENALSTAIENQRASAVATGTAQANAGASGTGGTGIDMQIEDISVESSRNHAKAQMMKDRQLDQLQMQREATYNQFQSRVQTMPNQKPSKGASLLRAGSRGFRNVLALGGAQRAWEML